MKCQLCKRNVRNSFVDKLEHIAKYHPEHILQRFQHLPDLSRTIGERMADKLKGLFQ